MNRYITFAVVAALALVSPSTGAAQTQDDRDQAARERAREQARIERDRAREQSRRERDQERERLRAASSLDTTVTFDARGTVNVSCPGGEVVVTASDRNEIRVHAHTESGGIRFSSTGERANLEPTQGRCSDGRFEVVVPVGARVSASSWSGSVSVRGVHGDVETHTQSADVELRDVGRLDVETMSGDVTIQGVKGDVVINSLSGDVSLSGARGDVEAETVSGGLELHDVVAKQVRTNTTSGDVEFSGPIMDGGRYDFNTHSGEIHLLLSPDVGAQLSVSTFSGTIDSDFPIVLKAGEHGPAKRLNFTLGQGSARILAETFSGDINLTSTGRR